MRAAVCARSGSVVVQVDVDEAAPVFGELLVADDSTEPPDGGLVDGTQCGSGCRLRVGGDQIQAAP